ncbi:universal stress protein [Azospirillum canadense]|uniref:universal stress protein n=1 Tax=Azospirillum canadense TaxID=403962 RepID=UPI002227AC84|nr:universal stress protein [Azospirillum canadense]MCW2242594.1 nucleotide-binding universal stress UspA family protein [Azospirillum canadense]
MYTHMLLPTDGSELCETAVRSGLRLAKSLGATVTVLHVVVDTGVAAGIGKAMRDETAGIHAAQEYLNRIGHDASRLGVPHTYFYVVGDSPAAEIVQVAENRRCDLIVMASHTRPALATLLVGSQTAQVLRQSKVPVLVYR